MQRSLRHAFGRRALAALLALGWVLGPVLPSIACTLTNGAETAVVHESMPDCHRGADSGAAPPATTARDCCGDVTTSCCLQSLDIDGALAAIDSLAPPALALLPATIEMSLPMLRPAHSIAVARDTVPPPIPLFRVLRL